MFLWFYETQTHIFEFDLVFDRVSGKTGLQECLWKCCSFSWEGCEWQNSHLNTSVTQTAVDENKCINSQAYPSAWRKPLTALTAGTREARLCAGWFSLLKGVIHCDLLTLFMHFWPPLYCHRNGTYRHATMPSVPSLHTVEMHLFSCLETTVTVKWASGFLTFPFKHSLEESTRGSLVLWIGRSGLLQQDRQTIQPGISQIILVSVLSSEWSWRTSSPSYQLNEKASDPKTFRIFANIEVSSIPPSLKSL